MRTRCSREILTKKIRQQQNFDSDLKGAWHYNHVTFTPIAKFFLLYCRLIYMLSILCVKLMIKAKVGIPERLKVGWYRQQKTGSSQSLNSARRRSFLIRKTNQYNSSSFKCSRCKSWATFLAYSNKFFIKNSNLSLNERKPNSNMHIIKLTYSRSMIALSDQQKTQTFAKNRRFFTSSMSKFLELGLCDFVETLFRARH